LGLFVYLFILKKCFIESSFTSTIKLDEEKSKHACLLGQQQGIGPEFFAQDDVEGGEGYNKALHFS
jgi:hypothetical protein